MEKSKLIILITAVGIALSTVLHAAYNPGRGEKKLQAELQRPGFLKTK